MEQATVVLDALILVWLIGTWFYEGHHRRCQVQAVCASCGKEGPIDCTAGPGEHIHKSFKVTPDQVLDVTIGETVSIKSRE